MSCDELHAGFRPLRSGSVPSSEPTPAALRVPVVGGDLVAASSGSGPLAVLLHGGPGLSDYLAPLADELSGGFRCVRYQQRGVEPAPMDGPLDVSAHVADVLAVVEAAGGEA